MKTLALSAAILVMAAGATSLSAGRPQVVDPAALPQNEARTLFYRACSNCHDMNTVVLSKRLTPRQWKDVTEDMITRGVMASDDEIAQIVEFLAINVGHVNVNRATEADLKTYGGFSAAEATAIVAARTAGTAFKTLDDLKAVKGVDAKGIDDRKDRIAFSDR